MGMTPKSRAQVDAEFQAIQWAVADQLRDARRKAGWSISRLAEEMGVAKSFLSQVESGTRNVSVAYLAAAFEALGYRLVVSAAPKGGD